MLTARGACTGSLGTLVTLPVLLLYRLQPGEVWTGETVLRCIHQEHWWPPEEEQGEGFEEALGAMRPPSQPSKWI